MNATGSRVRTRLRRLTRKAVFLATAGIGQQVVWGETNESPDWTFRLEKTVTYKLGVRAPIKFQPNVGNLLPTETLHRRSPDLEENMEAAHASA